MAEDKRFAQFAVPESALASRCSLGFFDRCTVFLSLLRPPDALGQNAHAAQNAPLGSNLHVFQKQQPIRKRVWAVAGGGQEIRNTPETFHLVPPSVKKSGFKPFLHIHLSSAFTAFHQNKGHIKDTESSSSTAAVTRQRLFLCPSSVQEVNKYRHPSNGFRLSGRCIESAHVLYA
ncbi:hypothetical protein [uncultured Ruminococcus sp.]|uniref:hypothetical protein n=1 Tax=uncultured Ruminococcus sp. TaxID=165186 RepID=UPI002930C7A4|nr:hypothetical protein [uncultured Ruminococcus sp.]